jgi:DNA-binding transcriptional LysR family regulator
MNLGGFDLNLMIALDALLREKNVTRAAERVFVSQPALAKLRDQFNDPLLVRVGREFELTARGLALVEPVREMLRGAQAVLGTQPVFDLASVQRNFRIMLPDFATPSILTGVMQRLVEFAPGVRLTLENWSSAGPAQLANSDLDLLVAFDNPEVLGLDKFPESLCRAPLQPVRWVCVVANDHPDIGTELTREQFLGLPHVSVRVPGLVDGISLIRKRVNMELDVRVATGNILEMAFLVAGTRMIAVMPETLARQLAGLLDIKVLEIPEGLVPTGRVELFWHRRNEPDPAHAWLRSVLLESAAARQGL